MPEPSSTPETLSSAAAASRSPEPQPAAATSVWRRLYKRLPADAIFEAAPVVLNVMFVLVVAWILNFWIQHFWLTLAALFPSFLILQHGSYLRTIKPKIRQSSSSNVVATQPGASSAEAGEERAR